MNRKIETNGLTCLCSTAESTDNIAYILYPMEMLDAWIEGAAEKYKTNIVVITGMDWDNVFSPWPAPGEPPGSPDFKGESRQFLTLLEQEVVPDVEKQLGIVPEVARSLVGVSMSGLFALWQWMVSDTFFNIASLSGSFWFPGFTDWMRSLPSLHKEGKAYFLLGNQEAHSPVKAFRPVGENTQEIIGMLREAGDSVEFQSVPGNHFADPIGRLDRAMTALYSKP